jgi:hypothetical protein
MFILSLKKEQEHLLQLERERRVGLEDQWEEKDKILEEARNKLLTLESERLEGRFLCSYCLTIQAGCVSCIRIGLTFRRTLHYSNQTFTYSFYTHTGTCKTTNLVTKFYSHHHDLVDRYGISVSQMTTDMLHLS